MNAADILAGGARLVRTQPKAVAVWGLLYLIACVAMMAAVWPMFADLASFQQQAIAAQGAGLPPPPPPGGFFAAILLLNAALLALFAVIFAAAVRAVALSGRDRYAFLRLGGDELRLAGLGILLVLLGFIVFFAIILVVILAVAGLAAILGPQATGGVAGLTIVLMLGVYALVIWGQVRLSLAGALTVLRGRIVIREAWRLTRGRFWTLFGVYLLVGIVYFALKFLILAIVNPDLLTAYAGGMQPEAMQAVLAQQQAMLADWFGPRMIVGWLVGAVVVTVLVAFTFDAVATAAIGFDRADGGPAPAL